MSRSSLLAYAVLGMRDIGDAVRQWRIWYLMGSSEMRRRYARSKVGQLWIILSGAILFTATGLVWSRLWNQPIRELLPYVTVSMVIWQLLVGILMESATALPANSQYFLNQYTPVATVIQAVLYRHFVSFLLNMIVPLVFCVMFDVNLGLRSLLSLLGLVLVLVTTLWAALLISILCTRFRDLIQIVGNILQVAFFVTPVLWKPELLPVEAQALIVWNPFAALLSVVRDPLLDRPVSLVCWATAAALAIGGLLMSLPFIGKYRRRLINWL